jgi:hypothetical protein
MTSKEILDLKELVEKILVVVESSELQVTTLSKEVAELKSENVKQRRLITELKSQNQESVKQLQLLGSCFQDLEKRMAPEQSVVHEAVEEMEEKLKTYAEAAKQSQIAFMETKEAERRLLEDERRQQQLRANNCKISGLQEREKENTKEVVTSFLQEQLKVHEPQVLQAYRIGKSNNGYSRPILVKFIGEYEKAKILANRSMLKGQKIWIDHDLTPTQWQAKKVELDKVKKAQGEGWIAYMRDGQAVITQKKKDMMK